MSTKKLENITQECVQSWSKRELYTEFSKMTDILQWIEKNETMSPDGKQFMRLPGPYPFHPNSPGDCPGVP